jgi:hypothetical protein
LLGADNHTGHYVTDTKTRYNSTAAPRPFRSQRNLGYTLQNFPLRSSERAGALLVPAKTFLIKMLNLSRAIFIRCGAASVLLVPDK